MSYKRFATNHIKTKRWTKLWPYLFERFLEYFGTNDEIDEYNNSATFPNKENYFERVINCKDWVLTVREYQEFLDWIVTNLPKKFSKKEAKKILPMIDLYMWPMTIELAESLKEEKKESE